MFRHSLSAVSPQGLTPQKLEQALGGSVVDFVGVGWLLFGPAQHIERVDLLGGLIREYRPAA